MSCKHCSNPNLSSSTTCRGLGNLTHIGGFPLYLSKPHYLESDPYVQEMVLGLAPDPVDHLTFIDVEPRSGVTFRTHKRVQINAGLSDLSFPPLGRVAARAFIKGLGMPVSERAETCLREPVDWKVSPSVYPSCDSSALCKAC